MDIPTNILSSTVFNAEMCIAKSSHMVVARECISIEYGTWGYLPSHEGNKGMSLNIRNDMGYYFAISLRSANNFAFALSTSMTGSTPKDEYCEFTTTRI